MWYWDFLYFDFPGWVYKSGGLTTGSGVIPPLKEELLSNTLCVKQKKIFILTEIVAKNITKGNSELTTTILSFETFELKLIIKMWNQPDRLELKRFFKKATYV